MFAPLIRILICAANLKQLKHISATPFKTTELHTHHLYKLPDTISSYIDEKLPPGHKFEVLIRPFSLFSEYLFSFAPFMGVTNFVQDKLNMEVLSQNFFQKLVESSIPTIKAYVDDMLPVLPLKLQAAKQNKMIWDSFKKKFIHLPVPEIRDDNFVSNSDILNDLIRNMDSKFHISEELTLSQHMVELSKSIPKPSLTIEELICPKMLTHPNVGNAGAVDYSSDISNARFIEGTF